MPASGSKPVGNHLRILAYHTIDRYDRLLPAGVGTSPEDFARQMEMLSTRWRVIPLDEMVGYAVSGRPAPADAISLTFDDGYRDNYLNAFPVHHDLGLPATIFCVASHLGRSWPAEDWGGTAKPMLGADDMHVMGRGGVEFGSHGNSHRTLTGPSTEDLTHEIAFSKETIEELTGRSCRYLSYPFGAEDESVRAAARSAGYEAAFAVWTPRPDRWAMNRIPVHTKDRGLRFRLKLLSYPHLRPLMARWRAER
jgi:peptidoglycan/xylan/chitin deacetylase (PgdA/CDA1 family)